MGAALALVLSVAAVALGAAALLAALRDDDGERGRFVQTRLVPSESAPALFPLHEFYASTGEDGVLRALYVYPPGFYGHERGCQVVWAPSVPVPGVTRANSGEFVDPCSGERFAADGTAIFSEANRGLDRFKTEPGIEGMIVDTRTLYCGPPLVSAPLTATAQASAPTAGTTPGTQALTTPTPASTATRSDATVQRETFEECDRVSADAD